MSNAIRAAEVEAVLSARDQMSAVLAQISESGTRLETVLTSLGSTVHFDPQQLQVMTDALTATGDRATSLRGELADIIANVDTSGLARADEALAGVDDQAMKVIGGVEALTAAGEAMGPALTATSVINWEEVAQASEAVTELKADGEGMSAALEATAIVNTEELSAATAQIGEVTAAAEEMGGALATAGEMGATSLGSSVKEAGAAAAESGGMFAAMGDSIGGAWDMTKGFIGAQLIMGGVSKAIDTVKESTFGMNASLETSTLQFTTLMGNSDAARQHVKDLFDFAAHTPFATEPIIQASRIMRVFGGDALDNKANLTLFGDTAAATGAPLDRLASAMSKAYAEVQGGHPLGIAARELMLMGAVTPKVTDEMVKMQKEGKSSAQVWGVMTDWLHRFDGGMSAQAHTWTGMMTTFTDTLNLTASAAFKPFFSMAESGLSSLNQMLGSGGVQKGAEGIATALATGLQRIGPIFGAVGALIGAAFSGIGMVAQPVLSAIDTILTGFDNLGRSTGKVAGSIGGPFEKLGGILTVLLSPITNIISADWESFITAGVSLDNTFASLAPVIGAVLNQVRGLVPVFLDLAGTFIDVAGSAIEDVFKALQEAVAALVPHIVTFIGQLGSFARQEAPLFTAVMRVAQVVIHALAGALAALAPHVGSLIDKVMPLVSAIGRILIPILQVLFNVLGVVLPPVITVLGFLIGQMFDAMGDGISVLTGIINWIANLSGWFAKAGPAAGSLGQTLSQVFRSILEVVGSVIGAVGGIWDGFVGMLETVAGVIGGILLAMWEPLRMALIVVAFVVFGILGLFEQLVGAVASVLSPFVSGVIGFFKSIVDTVIAIVTPFVQALVGLWEWEINTVIALVSVLWQAVSGFFRQLWQDVSGFVGNLVRDVVNFFSPVVTNILGALGNAWNALSRWGSDLIGGFLSAVQSAWGGVTGWLGNVVGMILTAVGNLGSTLWNAGADLINGLINGIRDNAWRLIQAIHDHVIDNIPQPIRDALGIHSPSTVAEEITDWFGQGLVNGLVGKAAAVAAASKDLAGQVSSEAMPVLSADAGAQLIASSAAAAGGGVSAMPTAASAQGASAAAGVATTTPHSIEEAMLLLRAAVEYLKDIAVAAGAPSPLTVTAAVRRA